MEKIVFGVERKEREGTKESPKNKFLLTELSLKRRASAKEISRQPVLSFTLCITNDNRTILCSSDCIISDRPPYRTARTSGLPENALWQNNHESHLHDSFQVATVICSNHLQSDTETCRHRQWLLFYSMRFEAEYLPI